MDCTKNQGTCQKYGVQGYPTLILFEDGLALEKYQGERTLNALIDFVTENAPATGKGASDDKSEPAGSPVTPLELTDNSFQSAIAEGVVFVKFYAPWYVAGLSCPVCHIDPSLLFQVWSLQEAGPHLGPPGRDDARLHACHHRQGKKKNTNKTHSWCWWNL